MVDANPQVFVDKLSRTYQIGGSDVHALRGLDLAVRQGEFLAVVGVSGSGKSTLLHLIGGLDTPTSGQIEIDGRRLGEMTTHERTVYRRSVVGFVFQSFYLVPRLTADANVRLALTFQGTYGAERRRRAAEALARVGLEGRSTHRPGQLSGGEQQRVSIARAIVHGPRLLLADEPTGNLDRKTATSLLDLLREVNRESNMTVIMVTHDEQLVADYCDRLVRLEDGELVESTECRA